MRLHVHIVGALIVTVLLVGAGCGAKPVAPTSTAVVPPGYQTYDAQYYYFSISHPADWTAKNEEQNASAVEIYSPAESNLDIFTENVNVIENRLITTMSLDTYLANALREIKTLEDYKEIGVTDIVLDGYPGKRVEYTINYPTDAGDIINLHMIQYLTIASASENAYIVTCTLQKNSKPAFTEQCDQIAKSLKIHTTQIN